MGSNIPRRTNFDELIARLNEQDQVLGLVLQTIRAQNELMNKTIELQNRKIDQLTQLLGIQDEPLQDEPLLVTGIILT